MFAKRYRYYMVVKYVDKEGDAGIISFFITMNKNPSSIELERITKNIEKDYDYQTAIILFIKRLEKLR